MCVNKRVGSQVECPIVAWSLRQEVTMQRGWLRVMVRYPLVVLVEEARLRDAPLTVQ